MGANFDYTSINYRDQREVDNFLLTTFDRYDRNRDGVLDYTEFQIMKDDLYQTINKRYGYGPTGDKLRAFLPALDIKRGNYITRSEFMYRAKNEVLKIFTSLNYTSGGYYSGMSGIYGPPPPPPPPPPYGYVTPSFGVGYGAPPPPVVVAPPTTTVIYI